MSKFKINIPKDWFSFSSLALKKPSADYIVKMQKSSKDVERNEKYYLQRFGNLSKDSPV